MLSTTLGNTNFVLYVSHQGRNIERQLIKINKNLEFVSEIKIGIINMEGLST